MALQSIRRFWARRSTSAGPTIFSEPLESRCLLSAVPSLWASDSNGLLYTVNVSSGATQTVGKMNAVMFDLAFNKTGQLYGIDGNANLYGINTTTAAATLIGNFGMFANSLVFSPTSGQLLAAGNNILFSINPATAARTNISTLGGHASAGDLAYDASGNLYLSASNGDLLKLNPTTGAVVDVGATGFSEVYGMAYGPNQVMYGLSDATDQIFTVNLATGQGTATTTINGPVNGVLGSTFYGEANPVVTPQAAAQVFGNGKLIPTGDTTPSAADGSSFGNVNVGAVVSHTFTVFNNGSAALDLTGKPLVTLSGAGASNFTVTSQPASAALAPDASTTFVVKFVPSAAGLCSATVTLNTNDPSAASYHFAISGQGVAVAPAPGATLSIKAVDPNAAAAPQVPFSTGMFEVTAAAPLKAAASVTLALSGSAAYGVDYTLALYGGTNLTVNAAAKTVTFQLAAGATQAWLLLTPILGKYTHVAVATLSLIPSSSYAAASAAPAATVYIVDLLG